MIISTMAYNGLDTRVSKTDSTGAKTFKRAGVGVISAVLSDGAASYAPGISEKRAGVSTFYSGGIKNTDTQTDASQAVTASRLYDAFGNVIASTGTWKSPFGNAGKFGYQEDPDTGLKLLGHRYYDSSTGRFLTRDPAYDGRNWYDYCGNNPVVRYDALGLGDDTAYIIGAGEARVADAILDWWEGLPEWAKDIISQTMSTLIQWVFNNANPKHEDNVKEGEKRFPEDFEKKSSRKGGGTRFIDPENGRGNNGRIDPDPEDPDGSHVHVIRNGHPIGRGGKILDGSGRGDPLRHIPWAEWKSWKFWFGPSVIQLPAWREWPVNPQIVFQ